MGPGTLCCPVPAAALGQGRSATPEPRPGAMGTAGVSLSLLYPESCAHSWPAVDPRHWKSLSRAGGMLRGAHLLLSLLAVLSQELCCCSSFPRWIGASHGSWRAGSAQGSEQPHPLGVVAFGGGCDRELGGPQHTWRLQGQRGLRSEPVALLGTLLGHHRCSRGAGGVFPLCLACAGCGRRPLLRARAKILPPSLSPGAVPRGCVVSGVRELVKRQENGSCLS